MNLIEKLIEAEIKETERLCKDIQPDSEYYNGWQKILTDLRNALQEYKKMLFWWGQQKKLEHIASRINEAKEDKWPHFGLPKVKMTDHPLKELKNPKNPD